jgi:hypothetical protein
VWSGRTSVWSTRHGTDGGFGAAIHCVKPVLSHFWSAVTFDSCSAGYDRGSSRLRTTSEHAPVYQFVNHRPVNNLALLAGSDPQGYCRSGKRLVTFSQPPFGFIVAAALAYANCRYPFGEISVPLRSMRNATPCRAIEPLVPIRRVFCAVRGRIIFRPGRQLSACRVVPALT